MSNASPWLVTCSCGWGREASSEWAATAVSRLQRQLADIGTHHFTQVEGPGHPHTAGEQLAFDQGSADDDALADAKFSEDKKAPNGSSIAVLLEFAGQRALLLGDAHPSLVLKGLQKLSPQGPLDVHCVKLSHHGSRNNTHKDLIRQLHSPRWIFSSDGAQTRHPNREAVALVLKHGSGPRPRSLIFNYRTEFNDCWDEQVLKDDYEFITLYGDEADGITVDLL